MLKESEKGTKEVSTERAEEALALEAEVEGKGE